MQVLKFGVLALALAVAVGCSSKRSGDTTGSGDGALDPNASGYGSGGVDGTGGYGNGSGYGRGGSGAMSEAQLRAITTFYFEYDSADLKPEAMASLDVHARDLKSSGKHVVLEGHTDERGTREYNMALGERRADRVKRYLILQGVAPGQLETVSYGKERPAVQGTDEYSMSMNRRVELRK